MSMKSNLHQSGVSFLKQLARHAEIIMQAYLSGSIGDHELDQSVLDKLLKNNILYRPEPRADLRLRRVVRALLEEALRDDRNRQIDANVGSTLSSLKTLAAHYKEARHNMDYAAAEAYLADLSEHVYAFNEGLRHSIRVLWSRINNEFGYVGTINAKIRENELAQTQVTELLDGLEMVSFAELTEIAGDIRELRHLMVTTMQTTLSDCAQELGIVQARLLELLGRFREIRGRTRLLKGWLLYRDQHPDYQVSDHVTHKNIPKLFNSADAILSPAAIDVYKQQHEAELMELVTKIKTINLQELNKQTLMQAPPLILEEVEDYELPDNPVREAVNHYFCFVIDSGKRQSALEYHYANELPWDSETWLHQIIGGYDGLPQEQKYYFELDLMGAAHPVYSGNFIIEDVTLWLA